jgi:hypothetical protein
MNQIEIEMHMQKKMQKTRVASVVWNMAFIWLFDQRAMPLTLHETIRKWGQSGRGRENAIDTHLEKMFFLNKHQGCE